jgi:hypothetical protein
VAGEGFEVTFNDLFGGADEFKAQGESILSARLAYRSGAELPDSAFGNLPSSKTIASQYQEVYKQVSDDMTRLSTALLDGTAKLALSATLYKAAEEFAAALAQLPADQLRAFVAGLTK